MPLLKKVIEDIAAQGVRGYNGVGGCHANMAKNPLPHGNPFQHEVFEACRDYRSPLGSVKELQPIQIAPL